MNTIQAIHIDPFTKTIRLLDMPNDFERMKAELLQCGYAEAVDLGEGVTAWVDEEGLLMDWDKQAFCCFILHEQTLAGHIVMTGTSQGGGMGDLPADVDVEFVTGMVRWLKPQDVRVPAPTITTWGGSGPPVTAPLDSKTTEWNYANQP